MTKTTSNLPLLVAAGIATIFMANVALAQPQREPVAVPSHPASQNPSRVAPTFGSTTGGGTSDADMDHRTMGALSPSAVDRTGSTTGEGTGDATMDHSHMGMVQGPGIAAQIGSTSGGGTNDAEISRGLNIGPPQR